MNGSGPVTMVYVFQRQSYPHLAMGKPLNPHGKRESACPRRRRYWWTSTVLLFCNLGVTQTVGPAQAPSAGESPRLLTLLESLESTLANEPHLQIQQQQVEISRALKQQATGQFDLTLAGSFSQAHTNSPLTQAERALVVAEGFAPLSGTAQNLSILNLGATKLYRTGVQISPVYQTTRTTDNLTTTQGANVSSIAFQIVVPLLRGRGRTAVGAQETSASVEVSAALLDLNQTISDLLAGTATNYWNAVAAARQLEVAWSSEKRGRTYVDNVQVLIQAERMPKSEINQATANLAKRAADRIAAEQNLVRAQQELAVAIGLDVAQMRHINFSFEDFPQPDLQRLPVLNAEVIAEQVQQALSRRADYLATQRRVEESNVLLAAARNALKPQLNLNFNTGVSGLSEGTDPAQFLNSPYRSIQGLDATAGITYNYPVHNNVAIGQMRQAQAALTQAQLRSADVRRRASSAIITSLNAVHNSAMQLDKARESVRFFEAALEGEREKFSLEFASLVDVLTIEDRLTTAMTDQVSAELGYAVALTQLRSATGTIVDPYEEVHSVDRSLFFNMP